MVVLGDPCYAVKGERCIRKMHKQGHALVHLYRFISSWWGNCHSPLADHDDCDENDYAAGLNDY